MATGPFSLTFGGVTYTVYARAAGVLADAKAYFNAHIEAATWLGADALTQERALVTAFRAIERESWTGTKLVGSQATDWPRTGATCDGEVVPDGTPDDIALGEYELALALIKDPTVLDKKSTRSDIKSVQAGTAAVSFFSPQLNEATRFPTVVQEFLGCFLQSATGGIALGLASGTDEDSAFTADDWERDEPIA